MRFSFYLTEMAYHQDRSIEKIEDLLPQVVLHIFKCLTMPGSRDYNHWLKEIQNWIFQMDDFCSIKNGKRIRFKVFLREYEQKMSAKYLLKRYDTILYQYDLGEHKHLPNPNKCVKFVQGFLNELLKDLSEDKLNWIKLEYLIKDFEK